MENRIDKAPLQSKKFLAYFAANLLSKAYLFFATARNESDIVIVAAIMCATFLDVGYLLGQASLDKYIRMTEIATKAGSKIK